jgi:hypothetical protein
VNKNTKIIIKKWDDLTPEELRELNASHYREWKIPNMGVDKHKSNIFFLLKDEKGVILAQGQLVPVSGVKFDGEIFNIFGIGGIISNIKMQGFGRELMQHIKKYLVQSGKAGVGFIGKPIFYQKSGFLVNKEAIDRFVYPVGNKLIRNPENSDHICYTNSDDKFMEKVLRNTSQYVYLPRYPDW